MKTKNTILAALLACAFLPAMAADAPPAPRNLPTLDRMFVAGTPMRKAVKNVPYSAETVNETQQTLLDGNQIVNKRSSMNYRDSAGRTRQEVMNAKGEVRAINIQDPVAGVIYHLNPMNKIATKIVSPADIGRMNGEMARARIEQLRKEGKLPAPDKEGRQDFIIKRVEKIDGETRTQLKENVRIQFDLAQGPGDVGARLGPVLSGALGDVRWSSKATVKDLGSKDFDGVKANGKLRSYEIPAGEIGNSNPIVVSNENWWSPELQVTVYTKHSDPRTGERIYRMESLKREEPNPALFTVPSDYTVKDAMVNFRKSVEEKK